MMLNAFMKKSTLLTAASSMFRSHYCTSTLVPVSSSNSHTWEDQYMYLLVENVKR